MISQKEVYTDHFHGNFVKASFCFKIFLQNIKILNMERTIEGLLGNIIFKCELSI